MHFQIQMNVSFLIIWNYYWVSNAIFCRSLIKVHDYFFVNRQNVTCDLWWTIWKDAIANQWLESLELTLINCCNFLLNIETATTSHSLVFPLMENLFGFNPRKMQTFRKRELHSHKFCTPESCKIEKVTKMKLFKS